MKKGIKVYDRKPKPYKKIIREIDQEVTEWAPEEVKRELIKKADEFFKGEIVDKSHKENAKK